MRITLLSRSTISALLPIVLATACGEEAATTAAAEPFGVECTADEECGDLSCLCGVCTRTCVTDEDCSALGDRVETRLVCAASVAEATCESGEAICAMPGTAPDAGPAPSPNTPVDMPEPAVAGMPNVPLIPTPMPTANGGGGADGSGGDGSGGSIDTPVSDAGVAGDDSGMGGESSEELDAGASDAGLADAGYTDAGLDGSASIVDAGLVDAGAESGDAGGAFSFGGAGGVGGSAAGGAPLGGSGGIAGAGGIPNIGGAGGVPNVGGTGGALGGAGGAFAGAGGGGGAGGVNPCTELGTADSLVSNFDDWDASTDPEDWVFDWAGNDTALNHDEGFPQAEFTFENESNTDYALRAQAGPTDQGGGAIEIVLVDDGACIDATIFDGIRLVVRGESSIGGELEIELVVQGPQPAQPSPLMFDLGTDIDDAVTLQIPFSDFDAAFAPSALTGIIIRLRKENGGEYELIVDDIEFY